MNEGPTSFRLGLRGMKASAEASIVERDLLLAQQFIGARLHVAHLSTAEALKAVRRGKRGKVRSHLRSHAAPLCADRRRCWRLRCQLQDESAAAFGPDVKRFWRRWPMAPWTPSPPTMRPMPCTRNVSSLSALLSASPAWRLHLGLAITRLHREHEIPLARIVELLRRGRCGWLICVDGARSLAAAMPTSPFSIPGSAGPLTPTKSLSKSHNTPFDGWPLTGKVVATIVGRQHRLPCRLNHRKNRRNVPAGTFCSRIFITTFPVTASN